jgi:hypothetical protein
MKHLLMDPAFPDIVGEYAVAEIAAARAAIALCANDNGGEPAASELADPLFVLMARREIAATRLW